MPPDRNYEGLVDDDGRWYLVETDNQTIPTDFDYAPFRDLNELLKELTLAN